MTGVTQSEHFEQFTETGFRDLLRALKTNGYQFVGYGQAAQDRQVLWRHDLDCSIHRAARLAEIEAEEGAFATYFINPRCVFYNVFEPEIARLLGRIQQLGHAIGVHFDASAYDVGTWSAEEVEAAISHERAILELACNTSVKCVSWHNPDISNLLEFDADNIGGLVNAYSTRLKRDYAYCSDSNGYWRFQPMLEVINAGHPRLHLLTHPEWWTPEPMSPSARIDRAIMGRAKAIRRDYDAFLARAGRRNIKS